MKDVGADSQIQFQKRDDNNIFTKTDTSSLSTNRTDTDENDETTIYDNN